jgi:hypothetical protein
LFADRTCIHQPALRTQCSIQVVLMVTSVPSRAMTNRLTGPQGRYSALNPLLFISYIVFQYWRVSHVPTTFVVGYVRVCKPNHWASSRRVFLKLSVYTWQQFKVELTRRIDSGGNCSDLYSGDDWLWFRQGHRLSWQVFHCFPLSLQANAGTILQNKPRPLPSTLYSIRHSLIILPFKAI